MPDRLSVVVTRRLPEPVETRLGELFNVTLNETDAPMSRAQLAEAMKENGVVTTSSPGPIPNASRTRCRPAVPEETATP